MFTGGAVGAINNARSFCIRRENRSRAYTNTAPLMIGLSDEWLLVRSHSAWAFGKIGGEAAVNALKERAALETDADVQIEIKRAPTSATAPR